jgi:hypothetical protein
MCIGGMKTSRPTVYKRPNPQDIYYNGNIYDPKPEEDEAQQNPETAVAESETVTSNQSNPINQSNTGLMIY